MKVTYNWLKDFVEIKITPQALADKLTMAGLEVTSLKEQDDDFVFEMEVTSNRPDWLSVVGIAREVAAITGKKLKLDTRTQGHKDTSKSLRLATCDLRLEIEDKKDCPLYTAKIIRGVKVGPSPGWLAKRLESIGCRSVNNIVDITNYVLFTYGEPLHAFDLDKLSGNKILVRRAKNNEKLTTIDAEPRLLDPDILIIADEKNPLAIAGIMGGKETEVTQNSRNILLEGALFDPVTIRRGRQALGLASESAYRFERGVDPEMVECASRHALNLILEHSGGEPALAKSSASLKTKSRFIDLDAQRVNKILGANITQAKMKKTLGSLSLKTKAKAKNKLTAKVPAFRRDLNLEIDLVEEIARIYGFDNIPATSPLISPQASASGDRGLVGLIKNILVGLGSSEVITYSLVDKDLLAIFENGQGSGAIEILNPLSKEQEVLRSKLIPSLARCVAHNLNQKQGYVNIFEISRVFSATGSAPEENLALGIALCGGKSLWFSRGHLQDEAGFLHLKGTLEVLFERLGIKQGSLRFELANNREYAVFLKDIKIGALKNLDRGVLERLDIKNKEVFVAELTLEPVLSAASLQKKFIPLPRYPGIARDISLVLPENISFGQIEKIIIDAGNELPQEIKIEPEIIDYYKGKPIEPGSKGLTISCLYSSAKRTLTEAEINPVHSQIKRALQEELGARMR